MQYKEVPKGFWNSAELDRASAEGSSSYNCILSSMRSAQSLRVDRLGFDCNELFIRSILVSLSFIMLAALSELL